jgi:hypothetical protein
MRNRLCRKRGINRVKQRVYIETTIVSYLTAQPSRDLILAANQEVTREWWATRRKAFELHISQFVLNEAAAGDPMMARKRLEMLSEIKQLPVTAEVRELGKAIIADRILPLKANIDALHVSVAAVNDMDVLLTWNCRHLANAELLRNLARYLQARGYEVPVITTPMELMGE